MRGIVLNAEGIAMNKTDKFLNLHSCQEKQMK